MDEVIAWVSILGVTFSGAVAPDSGLIWSDVEGWRGLPDARGDGDSIPGGHGRFARTEIFRESRVITFKGAIYAADNHELAEVCERLENELAAGIGPMVVCTEATGEWTRWVEIDTVKIAPDHGRRSTEVTIDMIAPDPRRYGPLQVTEKVGLPVVEGGVRFPQSTPFNFGRVSGESRLSITNAGRIDLMPRILVSGGFSSVVVTDVTTGRSVRLEWPVAEGEVLVLDQGTRRAELPGVEVTRWMSLRQWFSIGPGETHEFRFEAEGVIGDPQMWAEYMIGAW